MQIADDIEIIDLDELEEAADCACKSSSDNPWSM